jgi:hypothetical protein
MDLSNVYNAILMFRCEFHMPWEPVISVVLGDGLMPRPKGLGYGRLTISPASTNVVLLIRRTVDLTPHA